MNYQSVEHCQVFIKTVKSNCTGVHAWSKTFLERSLPDFIFLIPRFIRNADDTSDKDKQTWASSIILQTIRHKIVKLFFHIQFVTFTFAYFVSRRLGWVALWTCRDHICIWAVRWTLKSTVDQSGGGENIWKVFGLTAGVSDEQLVNLLMVAHLCQVVTLLELINLYHMLSPGCEVTMLFAPSASRGWCCLEKKSSLSR